MKAERLQSLQKTIEEVSARDNDLVEWLSNGIESAIATIDWMGATDEEEEIHFQNLALMVDILEQNGVCLL